MVSLAGTHLPTSHPPKTSVFISSLAFNCALAQPLLGLTAKMKLARRVQHRGTQT